MLTMLKITKEDLRIIERQLYNKGRDIDVAFYNALFDEEAKDFIPDSLMLYMTKEGGMGNGLDIDSYNPNASVYQTYEALRILDALNFDSKETNEVYIYILKKICNYLFNRCPMDHNLWNPTVRSNEDFAHSEAYAYIENFSSVWGVHPTIAILGYLMVLCPSTISLVKKARKFIPFIESELESNRPWKNYDFISFNAFLGSLKKLGEEKKLQNLIEKKLIEEASKHIGEEDFNFPLYLSNVSLDNPLKKEIDAGLDRIIQSRKSHGLWEHAKDWGTNRYAEADSAALKWLGAETVKNLWLLMRYGRIEA